MHWGGHPLPCTDVWVILAHAASAVESESLAEHHICVGQCLHYTLAVYGATQCM